MDSSERDRSGTTLVCMLNSMMFLSLDALKFAPATDSDVKYFYEDPSGTIQGPFSETRVQEWYSISALPSDLNVRHESESVLTAIKDRAPPFMFTHSRHSITPPFACLHFCRSRRPQRAYRQRSGSTRPVCSVAAPTSITCKFGASLSVFLHYTEKGKQKKGKRENHLCNL